MRSQNGNGVEEKNGPAWRRVVAQDVVMKLLPTIQSSLRRLSCKPFVVKPCSRNSFQLYLFREADLRRTVCRREAEIATASRRSTERHGAASSRVMRLRSFFQQFNRRCDASAVNPPSRDLICETASNYAEFAKPIYAELSSVARPRWQRP